MMMISDIIYKMHLEFCLGLKNSRKSNLLKIARWTGRLVKCYHTVHDLSFDTNIPKKKAPHGGVL